MRSDICHVPYGYVQLTTDGFWAMSYAGAEPAFCHGPYSTIETAEAVVAAAAKGELS